MSAIEKVTAHYEARGRREIDVPEWGIKIYSTPLTVRNRTFLQKKNRQSDAETALDLVMLKACDVDGNRLFEDSDRKQLEEAADSDILSRIALQMMAGPSLDDAKKN